MAFLARARQIMKYDQMKALAKKYGKVAIGVHFSVSAASFAGLYVAINNNVDVESIFQRFGMSPGGSGEATPPPAPSEVVLREPSPATVAAGEETLERSRNRTRELAVSSGGAFALALMCNKALIPVRIPITLALTPPVARFLARYKIVKT